MLTCSFLAGAMCWGAEGELRLRGAVLLPDGQPAAGAAVRGACWHSPTATAQASEQGSFELASEFAGPAIVSALSADGKHAASLWISEASLRKRVAEPVVLKLTPARRIAVVVRKEGKPVAGVQVGHEVQKTTQRTDARGRAEFSIPADDQRLSVSAWDPQRGVGGRVLEVKPETPLALTMEIDLQPGAPMSFRALDEFDRPAAGLKVVPDFRLPSTGGGWFSGGSLTGCGGTTDAKGEWTVPWAPAKADYAQIGPDDPAWEHDGNDESTNPKQLGALHVRRVRLLKGRVAMPAGASPDRLLVHASSFGARHRGASSGARVRANGTFELPVVSDNYYTIGIVDEEWTAPPRHGVLFRRGEEPPQDFVLTAEPATVVEVRVVAGKDSRPVAKAWVNGGYHSRQEWKAAGSEPRFLGTWIAQSGYTDERGIARFSVPRAEVMFHVSHGNWHESIDAKPPKSGPYVVAVRKPFVDKLRVAGKVVPPPAAPGRVELRAVGAQKGYSAKDTSFAVPVAADGSFRAECDSAEMRLFAVDKIGKTSAWAAVLKEGEPVVMEMVKNGAYGGTAKNPDGDPLPSCEVTLFLDDGSALYSRKAKADAQGKFRFDDVPADAPLLVHLDPVGVTGRFVSHGQAGLAPGEQHLDAVDEFSEMPRTKPPVLEKALAIPVELVRWTRDARIWHAPLLVVATGPGKEASAFVGKLLDDEERAEASFSYIFPIQISAERLAADAEGKAEFARRGWPVPAAGEVVLAAVASDGKSLGHVKLTVAQADAPKQAVALLDKHAPAKTSAMSALDAALADAKKTNRRVLFQLGGLRCGPCYSFARWIDKHRAELEKDFVLLKFSNLHADWEPALERLALKPSGSIPWTAVLDADGKALATSDGPQGNFGFPSGRLGGRHFRKMLDAGAQRLTEAERDALAASLRKR